MPITYKTHKTKAASDRAKAKMKRDIIRTLRELPRSQWYDAIVRLTADDQVTCFQVFCAMEQSGELDELKQGK